MLKMVDGTGIIGVDMICPLGVSTPQPPNYDRVELEGAGMLVLPNSLDAPLERLELGGKTEQVQEPSPSPEYPQEIKNVGKWNEGTQKYEVDVKVNSKNVFDKNIILPVSSYNIKGSPYNRKYFYLKPNTSYVVRVSGHYTTKLHNTSCFLATAIPAYDNSEANGLTTLIPDANNTERQMVFETDSSDKMILKTLNGATDENLKKMLEQTDITIYYNNSGLDNKHEPYTEQTLTLTSDRPITKWDRLVEQGGQIGWLYGAKKYTVTGSENYIFGGPQYYSGISTNMYITNVSKMGLEAVCDRLTQTKGIWSGACNNKDGFTINSGNQIHMRFFNSLLGVNDDATMQEKKAAYIAYLKKEYEKGTPYEIVYQSLEPEFVPLPQSEQNAIRTLKTYYPTTVITADGGEVDPDIKVTYRKEI